ncbi:MAG TPA: polysaccharide deacetylase family protein [Longimicrobiales bacterium]
MIRRQLKASLEAVLVGCGAASLARRLNAGRGCVLAYHNIAPEGEEPVGDRSLHLPVQQFRAQLDQLVETHEVVPLDALLRPPDKPPRRPRVAITFDDAYRGAITCGVAELRARGLPATVFVAPAFIGGRSFWWDSLASGPEGLDDELRSHALTALRGVDSEIRRWAAEAGIAEATVPAHARAASEEELASALEHPGLSLGSHTWSHPNLVRIPAAELAAELELPLRWLRERFERVLPWLSYPYGMTSPAVEAAVARAGYVAALRVTGGLLPRGRTRPYALPRVNIPAGSSPRGFALRAAGLFRS